MVLARHVDEVHDHDATQVAQAQLAGNRLRGFQVGAEDGVVKVARAHEATGVHVHRGQGLGLVDHQVAPRLEVHAPAERAGDLLVDVEQVKDGPLAGVELQLGSGVGHEFGGKRLEQAKLLARIDADGLRLGAHQVAQHALHQVEILVEQRGRRLARGSLADALPGLAQVGDVIGQFLVAGILRVGAQDETARGPAVGGRGQAGHPLAQGLTLGRGNLLRHTDVVVLRQKHQQPTGNADLGGQAGALGADRVLEHLHQQSLAFKNLSLDRLHRIGVQHAPVGRIGRLPLPRRCVLGRDVGHEVRHVQERGAVEPDVDEGRLHAGQHPRHFAQVDVAHQPAFERALQVHFLHRALLHHRDAGFLWCPVDQDVLAHVVSRKVCQQASFTPAARSTVAVSCAGRPMMPE